MIRGAANGAGDDRQAFAERYQPIVLAYLRARWSGSALVHEVDDAMQEVFVEAFRPGGVLDRVDADAPGGFRPFFYGVIRNVALRAESKRARRRDQQPHTDFLTQEPDTNEARLTQIFDRQWARAIMREAAARQQALAEHNGDAAIRRVDLLRLRFEEGLPIREIADRWGVQPAHLHREYAKGRREFKRCLLESVSFHHPGTPEQAEAECVLLLMALE